jgi:hypothetical protein
VFILRGLPVIRVVKFTLVGDEQNNTHRVENPRERRTFLGVVG